LTKDTKNDMKIQLKTNQVFVIQGVSV